MSRYLYPLALGSFVMGFLSPRKMRLLGLVFAHGGVTPVGSHPQTPCKDRLTSYIVRIGPVPLDIQPLSDYQQSLIDTILSLKSKGWTDSQIANHFNLTGFLTPRGHQFIPQSIFSIRKKYAIRLQRHSGN